MQKHWFTILLGSILLLVAVCPVLHVLRSVARTELPRFVMSGLFWLLLFSAVNAVSRQRIPGGLW